MMNIYEHKMLQGFQGTHVAERACALQGPLIENCSELKLIIYSVPKARTLIPNTFTSIFGIIFRLHQHLKLSASTLCGDCK